VTAIRFRLVLVLSACMAVLAGVPAQAQDFTLGHFKCYRVIDADPLNLTVGTQDQFDIADQSGFEKTVVNQAFRFCNPVAKSHRRTFFDIPDRRAHLTLYLASPSDLAVTRRVVIDNQFGKKRLLTFGAVVLATPTMKNNEGFPEMLDHYKCYRAYGRSVDAVVSLRDQFHFAENVRVGAPILFCNPTRKRHETAVFGVQNASDHLTCYRLEPRPFEGTVSTLDQFGLAQRRLGAADILCAPTAKLRWDSVD
jgi:hypothetical protein